ncbi:MAG: hypothetical protein QM626_06550 [Microbacterium sp.]|uniref:hypothetical protein n=1 Tax=Microbacterium sp. TaxID=51671 RepID=UPI0039E380C8
MRRIVPVRLAIGLAGAAVLAAALAACAPDESASPSASATASATSSASASASASPTPTVSADDITLPGSCESIYSGGMLQTLRSDIPPLNDPAVTVASTKIVSALEILDAVPSLRCTWGSAGTSGIATTVAIVDADQAQTIRGALDDNGFSCVDAAEGTLCTASSTSVDTASGDIVEQGESHFLRGNAWIATTWLTIDPDGYTQDIAATLWG